MHQVNLTPAGDILTTLAYLNPTTVAEVEIGFVSRLKPEESVAKNLLTPLNDVQAPIDRVTERYTLRTVVSNGVLKNGSVDSS